MTTMRSNVRTTWNGCCLEPTTNEIQKHAYRTHHGLPWLDRLMKTRPNFSYLANDRVFVQRHVIQPKWNGVLRFEADWCARPDQRDLYKGCGVVSSGLLARRCCIQMCVRTARVRCVCILPQKAPRLQHLRRNDGKFHGDSTGDHGAPVIATKFNFGSGFFNHQSCTLRAKQLLAASQNCGQIEWTFWGCRLSARCPAFSTKLGYTNNANFRLKEELSYLWTANRSRIRSQNESGKLGTNYRLRYRPNENEMYGGVWLRQPSSNKSNWQVKSIECE